MASPRNRLSKLFHKRDASNPNSETSSPSRSTYNNVPSPSSAAHPTDGQRVRKMPSLRELKDRVSTKVGRSPSQNYSKDISPSAVRTPSTPAAVIAATEALNRYQDLPPVEHQSDLSSDLIGLNLRKEYSGLNDEPQIGAVPVIKRKPRQADAERQTDSHPANGALSGTIRMVEDPDTFHHPFTDGASDFDDEPPPVPPHGDAPSGLRVAKRGTRSSADDSPVSPISRTSHERSLAHKPDIHDLRKVSTNERDHDANLPGVNGSQHGRKPSVARSSLDKPLPRIPTAADGADDDLSEKHDSGVHSALGKERGYLVRDASQPVDLSAIVDLRNTEDTTVHEHWAPAVTHETVIENVHEIREEVITREIHEHEYFHRILPIVDVEVLPARHFVPVQGGYAEIAAEEIPGNAGVDAQRIVREGVAKLLPKSASTGPPRFSARTFQGGEGQYKESLAPEGFKRTETTWVHPPTLATGGQGSGQTYPFHFGSEDPAHDGLRARLPTGTVVGSSPLIAERDRERLRALE